MPLKKPQNKQRILVLGASGYIGNLIYKELATYFKTFGTYFTPKTSLEKNAHFFHYNVDTDDVVEILEACKPTIIISALRGDFQTQTIAHSHCIDYAKVNKTKIFFLSSANVFDAYSNYPSYELDKTLSKSIYGHFKIKIETRLLQLPKKQYAILRLPMVFGSNCPRIQDIKQCIRDKAPVEIFPNLVMNVALEKKLTQQIHYIINRNKSGIFHLGSTDLVHHDEFIKNLVKKITPEKVAYKHVYTTNNNRYLAVLPKYNTLPKHLQITSTTVLENITK